MEDIVQIKYALDTFYFLICGALVMWMAAGFAMLEAGLVRAKNTTEILTKNVALFAIACTMYLLVGYHIMYSSPEGGIFPSFGVLIGAENTVEDVLAGGDDAPYYSVASDFFFQVVFAATAVTIASGAMAERTKFSAYLIFSAVMTGFTYPVVVHSFWHGDGLLSDLNIGDARFSDFAGSSIVHSAGGWAALMGAVFLGPRLGKYGPDGRPRAIPGHNIGFVVIGVFILWFGWFGFNAGSELAFDAWVAHAIMTTLLAASAGTLVAGAVIWKKTGAMDVGLAGNGALAGLVSITAGTGTMNFLGAVIVGAIGGALVVYSVLFIERRGVDDPVGAVSVHGVCGVWGTLAIGLFARHDDAFLGRDNAGLFYGGGFDQLLVQAIGVLLIAAWVLGTSAILFKVLKSTVGLRVSAEEELAGLDVAEHGSPGYGPEPVLVG